MPDFSSSLWNKPTADDSDPVTRSLRFAQGDSPRLVRNASSIGTSTNPHKITISMWFKMGDVAYSTSGRKNLLNAANGAGSDYFWIGINGDNKLNVTVNDGSLGIQGQYLTNRVFRDPTAWMHLCVAVDSELAAEYEADRCKIFINGVRETSFSTTNHWPEDWDNEFNEGTYDQYISGWNNAGSDGTGSPALFFDGLIADVYNIDGAAIEPVGNFIEDTGYNSYKPKAFDMSSYGGNSFHLKFENSADIGADSSGNSNGFDSYGISGTTDQLLDTPNKNYATLNPLDPTGSDNTLSEANLKCVVSPQNTSEESTATIGISSGKWYWEQYLVSTTYTDGGNLKVGVKSDTGSKYWHVRGSDGETESDTGSGASNGSSSVSYDTTNIVGVAVDMDAGKWWVSVDGTFVGSPTAGTGELHSGLSGTVLPYVLNATSASGSHTIVCNFGQDPTFAGNKPSGQDTSQSEFYYAPPENFNALCSANFDDPTVKAHENFGVLTYTGNDTDDTSITGLDFQPNFTWIKQRSNSSTSHFLHDSERTQGDPTSLWNYLKANDDANESWDSDQFDGFLTNGFKVSSNGNSDDINKASRTYVAWNWKENASAGFDIVTWTGGSYTGGDYSTVDHDLDVAPEMIIAKNRTGNASPSYGEKDWVVYHKDLGNGDYGYQKYLLLNETDAAVEGGLNSYAAPIDNAGSLNFRAYNEGSYDSGEDQFMNFAYGGTADNYVAYLFASVDGVTKVGSYTGNSDADGPMVHCGFRPAFVMLKRVSNSDGWVMHDNVRDPDNGVQLLLQADSSADELGSGTDSMDFLATGFKLKVASTARNNSAEKYIFLAMAESPLKYANAR